MWFWTRKVSLSILWKPKMTVCDVNVKNVNNQWNKSEIDSRYLVYDCNNRIGDLLPLLPFSKKNIIACLIKQMYVVFYLGKVRYLVFCTGMILIRHLY